MSEIEGVSSQLRIMNNTLSSENSLRDRFAMAAMQGDWAAQGASTGQYTCSISPEVLFARARLFYRMADAMLKAREAE